ncbi:Toll/interleukin-1 receptor domain-containing protein [Tanacetum coccineum]
MKFVTCPLEARPSRIFFQDIKSKADRLANLDSPVKDIGLVTYAVNGIRSKYPDAARVIRLREKAPTFDELRSMMLLEESDMSHQSVSPSLLYNTSSSPTILVATNTNHGKASSMQKSRIKQCHNFQRGTCTYGSRCKFVHGVSNNRARPSIPTRFNNKNTSTAFSHNDKNPSMNGTGPREQLSKPKSNASTTYPVSYNQFPMHPYTSIGPGLQGVQAPPNLGCIYFQAGLGPTCPPVQQYIQPAQLPQAHMATAIPPQQA